jgi:hypothetical protein
MSTPVNNTNGSLHTSVGIQTYEQNVATNWSFAMEQGDLFFSGKSEVQKTLQKITRKLTTLDISHVVVGGLSLMRYGYVRYTDDVDLLVTREGLKAIHDNLEGLGYKRLFAGSKGLRDVETSVKIDFHITGDYPGDGKPKAISFPHPAEAATEFQGMQFISLPMLITLKMASGLSGNDRAKDIGDVEQLVKIGNLPESFAQQLPPSLQREYQILWQRIHGKSQRYVKLLNTNAPPDAALLEIMLQAGVECDKTQTVAANTWYLVTSDFTLARQFDMHPEDEFFFDNK